MSNITYSIIVQNVSNIFSNILLIQGSAGKGFETNYQEEVWCIYNRFFIYCSLKKKPNEYLILITMTIISFIFALIIKATSLIFAFIRMHLTNRVRRRKKRNI